MVHHAVDLTALMWYLYFHMKYLLDHSPTDGVCYDHMTAEK